MTKLRVVNGSEELPMARAAGGDDPFNFEKRGYSEDKFYVRSTGPGGEQGEAKYLKISPSILGAIAKIVYTKEFPQYRTDADFIRDAIVHRLKYINDRIADEDVDKRFYPHIRVSQIEAKQQMMAETMHMINMHEESMRMAVENEDWGVLEELLDGAEHDYNQLGNNYGNKLALVIKKYRDRLPKGKR